MMNRSEVITAVQDKAVRQLFSYKRLCVQWSTGVGKTRVGVRAVQRVIDEGCDMRILLCVAEVSHKQTWRDEFYDVLGMFEAERILSHCVIECYASMKKYANTEWGMIIFDEAHHLGSEYRLDLLMTMKAEYVLALSATMKKEVLDELSADFGMFIVNRYGLSRAINDEVLPMPEIITVPLELDRSGCNESFKVEWGNKKSRRDFGEVPYHRWRVVRYSVPAGMMIVRCSEWEKVEWINEEIAYARKRWMMGGTEWEKNTWLQKASMRKRILGEMKSGYISRLISRLKGEDVGCRLLCFCSSVAQAKEIGGSQAIHSKQKESENSRLINEFNEYKSNELYAVGKLVEGVNLVDCRYVIMGQLDGELRLWYQKVGRGMRHTSPVIYVLYFRGTRDEEWLERVRGEMRDVVFEEISI